MLSIRPHTKKLIILPLLFISGLSLCYANPVNSGQTIPAVLHSIATIHDPDYKGQAVKILKKQILTEAAWAMEQQPETVTAHTSPRSAGGLHDFFSEADYFWPNPANPGGAYITKDGLTNPDNFLKHRQSMIRFSKIIGALASAYQLTGDEKYVRQAVIHLKAWFTDPATLMNPNLLYTQAVRGESTGRSWGIIDTIHFMEVAQGIIVMEKAAAMKNEDLTGFKNWFTTYTTWLNTHPYGKAEKAAANNHGTCWTMQVASFAKLTGDQKMLDECRERYKKHLTDQMDSKGGFPLELKRTKPYGYSIFNLDAMTMICQILSDKDHDLWNFQTTDGRSLKTGINFLYPFIADKSTWTYQQDVLYWNNWPVAQPALLFGAAAFKQDDWFATWKKLDHDPKVEEVIRNLPVRHPLLWF